jgi:hypothetical protein
VCAFKTTRKILAIVAAAALTLLAFPLCAADIYWNVPSGDWSEPSNWDVGVPTAIDTAWIENGGTATITLPGEGGDTLNLSVGTVQMTGGDFFANRAYLGNQASAMPVTGAFIQSGGSATISNVLYLGYKASNALGNYTLTGTGTLAVGAEMRVGADGGAGRFEWFGGTLSTPRVTLRYGVVLPEMGTLFKSMRL